MRFKHYGKTFQLRVETAADLQNILDLDESLWVATSAPISVFRCDPVFLAYLDNNRDGRVNTREVQGSIRWVLARLARTDHVADGIASLALDAVRGDTDDGERLRHSAETVLAHVDAPSRETIALSDVRVYLDYLRQQPMNGDGVIMPSAATDPELVGYLEDVLAATGGTCDASGEQGVSAANLQDFQDAAATYQAWRARVADLDAEGAAALMPFGDDTPGMYQICREQAERVEVFFALCRTLEFEPRARALLGCSDVELEALDLNRLSDLDSCLAAAPLARPTADGRLPLDPAALNPRYRDWVGRFSEGVLSRVVGIDDAFLDESEWRRVTSALEPYGTYLCDKPGGTVATLPPERLAGALDGALQRRAVALIETDQQVTKVVEGVRDLEKLLLYHQYLLRFCNNFVSFSQLYDVAERALFEMGALVIDGRWFRMALKVEDLAGHEKIAKTSNIFTIYLAVTSEASETLFHIAVPATSGTRGNICVGKRGVFFDVTGQEYNAQVIKIIENPISLREGLIAPFVRLWAFIMGKIEGMSGATEKELQKQADTLLTAPATPTAVPGGPPGGPAAMLVGLSLSAAAIGSAFAFMTKTMTGMTHSQRLFGLLGAALLVSVPVSLIAIIKLNRQDLSSLLEGCGWAINARMRLSRAQRKLFTRREPFPAGAEGIVRRRWPVFAGLAVIALLILVLFLRG